MDRTQIIAAMEAILFVAGEPVTLAELSNTFARLWPSDEEGIRDRQLAELPAIVEDLKRRWNNGAEERGFTLVEVSGGLAFRSNPRFAEVLRAMHAQRSARLSRAALETLAIIAYRQPVTKPEIDNIRGVDCGGTIRLLLERRFVRIMGKKDEPGRPLIYGTTKEFLNFFNLRGLTHLPTLREFGELSQEALEELESFDGLINIEELRSTSKQIRIDSEPSIEALDEAVQQLKTTQREARDALAAEGIVLEEPKDEPPAVEGQGLTDGSEPEETPEPVGDDAQGDEEKGT